MINILVWFTFNITLFNLQKGSNWCWKSQMTLTTLDCMSSNFPIRTHHFSIKGMNILQTNPSLCRIPNMGNHIMSLHRIIRNQLCDGRRGSWFRVMKGADPPTLVKGDAPPMTMNVCISTPACESFPTECKVGWVCTVHSQQLTSECCCACWSY